MHLTTYLLLCAAHGFKLLPVDHHRDQRVGCPVLGARLHIERNSIGRVERVVEQERQRPHCYTP